MKRSLKQTFWLQLLVYILLVFAGTFATVEGMLAIQDWMNMRYTQQVLKGMNCCEEEKRPLQK